METKRIAGFLVSISLLAAGCTSSQTFVCTVSSECDAAPGGECVASTMACAYPVATSTCASGFAYAGDAGALAGRCAPGVPPFDARPDLSPPEVSRPGPEAAPRDASGEVFCLGSGWPCGGSTSGVNCCKGCTGDGGPGVCR